MQSCLVRVLIVNALPIDGLLSEPNQSESKFDFIGSESDVLPNGIESDTVY